MTTQERFARRRKKLEEKLKEVMTSERGNFRFMEPMKRHTTFRIGGPAAVFISPGSEEELREVLNLLKEENITWTILGNGSNLLVSDEGFKELLFPCLKAGPIPAY